MADGLGDSKSSLCLEGLGWLTFPFSSLDTHGLAELSGGVSDSYLVSGQDSHSEC